jgi:hypothetical protein
MVKTYQNHQRAWHSETEARKAGCRERSCPKGWFGLVACLLVSGKAVAERRIYIRGSPSPTNQNSNPLFFRNEHATGEKTDDAVILLQYTMVLGIWMWMPSLLGSI